MLINEQKWASMVYNIKSWFRQLNGCTAVVGLISKLNALAYFVVKFHLCDKYW